MVHWWSTGGPLMWKFRYIPKCERLCKSLKYNHAGTPGAQGRPYDHDLHACAAARRARGAQPARSALSNAMQHPGSPHPSPLAEGRGRVKLRPLRRRSRGERAPVKLGALCRRSRRGREEEDTMAVQNAGVSARRYASFEGLTARANQSGRRRPSGPGAGRVFLSHCS